MYVTARIRTKSSTQQEVARRRLPSNATEHPDAPLTQLFRLFNSCCLLEPLVAVTWQSAFAQLCGVTLSLSLQALLYLSLWLVYMGDHLLDGRHAGVLATHRHRFAHKHSASLWKLWGLVLIAVANLAFASLRPRAWILSLAVLLITTLYFACVHLPNTPRTVRRWFRKEIWVSVIYSGGASLFVLAETEVSILLIVAQILFAVLVLLNLLVIADDENKLDQLQPEQTLWRTDSRRQSQLTLVLGGYAVACAAASLLLPAGQLSAFTSSLAVGAGLILAVRLSRTSRSVETSHALYDLALLSPSLSLLVPH